MGVLALAALMLVLCHKNRAAAMVTTPQYRYTLTGHDYTHRANRGTSKDASLSFAVPLHTRATTSLVSFPGHTYTYW